MQKLRTKKKTSNVCNHSKAKVNETYFFKYHIYVKANNDDASQSEIFNVMLILNHIY